MSTIMAARGGAASRLGLYLRWIARGIVIAIAAFWVWFGIADGLGDAQTLGPMGFLMMLPAALICLATLYIVWRWELFGGLLLLVVTGLGAFFFSENMERIGSHGAMNVGNVLIGLAIFVLPFLIPALCLLTKTWLDRKRVAHPG